MPASFSMYNDEFRVAPILPELRLSGDFTCPAKGPSDAVLPERQGLEISW